LWWAAAGAFALGVSARAQAQGAPVRDRPDSAAEDAAAGSVVASRPDAEKPSRHLRVRFAWTAPPPPGCPDRPELVRRVETALQRSIFVRTRPDLVLRVELVPAPPGHRARLALAAPDGTIAGERALSVRGPCEELTEPLVLALTLMLDVPRAEALARIESARPAQPDSPDAPEPPRSSPEAPPSPSTEPAPVRYELDAGVVATLGWLPSPPVGFRLAGLVILAGAFSLEVEGAYWARSTATQGALAADVRAFHFGAAGCAGGDALPRLRLASCLGARVGHLEASGRGFSTDRSAGTVTVDGVLRLSAAALLAGPLGIRLTLGAGVPMVRPRLRFERDGAEETLYEPAPVYGVAELALFLRFSS
jgi:hypothetical protein